MGHSAHHDIVINDMRFIIFRKNCAVNQRYHKYSSLLCKDALGHRKLWRQVNVVPLQKMTAQTDILRVFSRTHVTRKVPLTAALELHMSLQVTLHLVRTAALWTFQRRYGSIQRSASMWMTANVLESVYESCK